jgi:hypothetical protein
MTLYRVGPSAVQGGAFVLFRRVQRAFVLHGPLPVPHGWDDTVKCSFDELAGSAVELVIAIFQAV